MFLKRRYLNINIDVSQINVVVFIMLFFAVSASDLLIADNNSTIRGQVIHGAERESLAGVEVVIAALNTGTATDADGAFVLRNIPAGEYEIVASYIGFRSEKKVVSINPHEIVTVTIEMKPQIIEGESVVVTGTRTERNRLEVPVIVNVLDAKMLEATQSLNLSEGLSFQPGVRLEVDCQTCNYTQVRMNGLGGAYSQILINSRPVFSPLVGLYGLEQIPSGMIERVEVVRGGGSALFGGSAIAGTINIITKEPRKNAFSIGANQALVAGKTPDRTLSLNADVLSDNESSGVSIFGNLRNRESYDANADALSELPRISGTALGLRAFFKPGDLSKITLEAQSISEERQGGDGVDRPPHEALQSEFRDHKILGGGITYDRFFNGNMNALSGYISGQFVDRTHYTGLDRNPDAYGTTENTVAVAGLQYDHYLLHFPGELNVITAGVEGQYDHVDDQIPGYQLRTNQITRQLGIFAQSDWKISQRISMLLGGRLDYHSNLENPVLSPRANLLVGLADHWQWRGSYATGFRAPQAFDADLHIAFSGGGISYIRIAENLVKERSQSFSTSLDFNRPAGHYFIGFTIEGFYTQLYDAFVLEEAAIDAQGNTVLERRNGGNSDVAGANIEFRLNVDNQLQFGGNITLQRSRYDDPVFWSSDAEPVKTYLRTPDVYGSFLASFYPVSSATVSVSGVYTGAMDVPHLAGYIAADELVHTPDFWEMNLRLAYQLPLNSVQKVAFIAGIQNLFDQFQQDFDKTKDRDSNYVYGPARPRTFFTGLKLGW